MKAVLAIAASDGAVAREFCRALPLDLLESWGESDEAAVRLLLAAICHHGRPFPLGGFADPASWRPDGGLDPLVGISSLVQDALSWFPQAAESGGMADRLPDSPAFAHAFCGLVTLADWLGSNEEFFPYSLPGEPPRIVSARERARAGLRIVGLDSASSRQVLGSEPPGFELIMPHPPNQVQRQCLELDTQSPGSLCIVEAETGSGKTEAALARFLRLYHAGQVDGLYFALPTRTSAVQIYHRVRAVVARAFAGVEPPPAVLAVPGYVGPGGGPGALLPGTSVLSNDEADIALREKSWAAERPKRFLAAWIAVGTIDQLLLSALAVPHAHLRALAALRHLLVVDEVHASDAYMTHILEEVLARHLRAGGHALLMSATLGTAVRRRLLWPGRHGGELPPLDAARRLPFPLVTYRHEANDGVAEFPTPGSGAPKQVTIELLSLASQAEEVARRGLEAASLGARVLVVRNTVKSCMATQQALEELARREESAGSGNRTLLLFRSLQGIVAPHHSRFAREDRRDLDRALEKAFGRNREEALGCGRTAGGIVAVATQTVQQSLDLDADFMLTDLCPMDVLLQRIGRLHRHRREDRPPAFSNPRVVVLTPPERDLSNLIAGDGSAHGQYGLGTVYEDLRVLEATWRLLEQRSRIEIPAMNRELVEETTHPERLMAIAAEGGQAWQRHQQWVLGTAAQGGLFAGLCLLDIAQPFGEAAFPDRELAFRIQTRLGAGDRTAAFPQPQDTVFGHSIQEINVPAHLAHGVPADASAMPVSWEGEGLAFAFGDRCFMYDHLGLRPLEERPFDVEETDA